MKCCIMNLVCNSGFINKQCKAKGDVKLGCRTFLSTCSEPGSKYGSSWVRSRHLFPQTLIIFDAFMYSNDPVKLICLPGVSVALHTCSHSNLAFVSAQSFAASWCKSDHLHPSLVLMTGRPAEFAEGGGEPRSQRNMAAPAAPNDATAAPSR